MTTEPAENDIRDAFNAITFDRPVSKIIAGAKRRQHRRRIVLGAIPALGLMAGWGAAFLTSDEVRLDVVGCYDSEPDDPNRGLYPAFNTGGSPESVCAYLWAGGHIAFSERGVVPPLMACVATSDSLGMGRGMVAVFPTSDDGICSRPGLQPVPDGYRDRLVPFAKMLRNLRSEIESAAVLEGGSPHQACLSKEQAVTIVAEALRVHGYNDWTVGWVGTADQSQPCWTYVHFDSEVLEAKVSPTIPGTRYITVPVR